MKALGLASLLNGFPRSSGSLNTVTFILLSLTFFILPWLQIGCLIACSDRDVELTNICLVVQTGDAGSVRVFASSRRSEVSGGTPPLDVRECL